MGYTVDHASEEMSFLVLCLGRDSDAEPVPFPALSRLLKSPS